MDIHSASHYKEELQSTVKVQNNLHMIRTDKHALLHSYCTAHSTSRNLLHRQTDDRQTDRQTDPVHMLTTHNSSTYGLQTKCISHFGQLNSLYHAVLMLLVYRKYRLVNPYANGLREVGYVGLGWVGWWGEIGFADRVRGERERHSYSCYSARVCVHATQPYSEATFYCSRTLSSPPTGYRCVISFTTQPPYLQTPHEAGWAAKPVRKFWKKKYFVLDGNRARTFHRLVTELTELWEECIEKT